MATYKSESTGGCLKPDGDPVQGLPQKRVIPHREFGGNITMDKSCKEFRAYSKIPILACTMGVYRQCVTRVSPGASKGNILKICYFKVCPCPLRDKCNLVCGIEGLPSTECTDMCDMSVM